MNEKDVKTIEEFFEWLPTFMAHGDTLQCEEDDYGNMIYSLYNPTEELILVFNSKNKKITRYD